MEAEVEEVGVGSVTDAEEAELGDGELGITLLI